MQANGTRSGPVGFTLNRAGSSNGHDGVDETIETPNDKKKSKCPYPKEQSLHMTFLVEHGIVLTDVQPLCQTQSLALYPRPAPG